MEVIVSNVAKDSVVAIVSDFLGSGPSGLQQSPEAQKRNAQKIADVMGKAKELTLTITTRCNPKAPSASPSTAPPSPGPPKG